MRKKNIFLEIIVIVIIFLGYFSAAESVKKNLYRSQEMEKTIEEKFYLVQIGDTLWKIAKKFYNNPQEWKRIYSANPRIKNPDRIYPGETLIIPLEITIEAIAPTEKITPLLEEKEEEKVEITTLTPQPTVELGETKEIPISRDKYLKMKFSPGNFLVPEKWQFDGSITQEKEKKILISAGDIVYLNIGNKKGLKPGMYGFVCRKGEKVYDSKTDEFKGRNIQRIGIIEIIDSKENTSSARVVTSSEAIEVGDGIKIVFVE